MTFPPIYAGNASNIVVGVEDFPSGTYNLSVSVRDVNGLNVIQFLESLQLSGLSTIAVV